MPHTPIEVTMTLAQIGELMNDPLVKERDAANAAAARVVALGEQLDEVLREYAANDHADSSRRRKARVALGQWDDLMGDRFIEAIKEFG